VGKITRFKAPVTCADSCISMQKTPYARKTQLPAFALSLPTTRLGNGLVTELLLKTALFCLFRSTQPKAYLLLST